MPSACGAHIKYAWMLQVDAVLNQANPVSGTLYPVLAASEDVRIISISINNIWTVQPSPLDAELAIDGVTVRHNKINPASATSYYAIIEEANSMANQSLATISPALTRSFLWEGQSVAVGARTTGGTVSNLTSRVKWARLLPT